MRLRCLLVLALLGIARPADALLVVPWEDHGTVSDVIDPTGLLDGSVAAGDAFAAFFAFDYDLVGTPTSAGTVYSHTTPPFGLVVEVGDYVFQTDPNDVLFDVLISESPTEDWYTFESFSNLTVPQTGLPDLRIDSLYVGYHDRTGHMLFYGEEDRQLGTPPSLPQDPINSEIFTLVSGCAVGPLACDPASSFAIRFDQLQSHIGPEPSLPLLLGVAALGLGARRRRRRPRRVGVRRW